MNSFKQFISQIKSANYADANQTFSEIMQQKVANRLTTERKSIFTEASGDADKAKLAVKHVEAMWLADEYINHEHDPKEAAKQKKIANDLEAQMKSKFGAGWVEKLKKFNAQLEDNLFSGKHTERDNKFQKMRAELGIDERAWVTAMNSITMGYNAYKH